MEPRDRRLGMLLLALAAVAWVGVIVGALTVDPRGDPSVGMAGAVALGVATGITAVPILWILAFARHRRIAYRGSWLRAARRGAWIGALIAVFVVMRLNGIFQLPIAVFLAAMALVAEVAISGQG